MKSNLYGLVQEWREFQRELLQDNGPLLALGALQTNGPLLATGGLQTNGPLLGPGGLQANGPLLGPGGLQANGPLLGPGGKKDQQVWRERELEGERGSNTTHYQGEASPPSWEYHEAMMQPYSLTLVLVVQVSTND